MTKLMQNSTAESTQLKQQGNDNVQLNELFECHGLENDKSPAYTVAEVDADELNRVEL